MLAPLCLLALLANLAPIMARRLPPGGGPGGHGLGSGSAGGGGGKLTWDAQFPSPQSPIVYYPTALGGGLHDPLVWQQCLPEINSQQQPEVTRHYADAPPGCLSGWKGAGSGCRCYSPVGWSVLSDFKKSAESKLPWAECKLVHVCRKQMINQGVKLWVRMFRCPDRDVPLGNDPVKPFNPSTDFEKACAASLPDEYGTKKKSPKDPNEGPNRGQAPPQ